MNAVIPAKAGIHFLDAKYFQELAQWIPAFAGMTALRERSLGANDATTRRPVGSQRYPGTVPTTENPSTEVGPLCLYASHPDAPERSRSCLTRVCYVESDCQEVSPCVVLGLFRENEPAEIGGETVAC